MREAAFKYLLEIKSTHSKVAHIHYKDLSAQNYLKNISDMKKQKEAVILFQLLIEERIKLYPPGVNLDPSTVSSL